MSVTFANNSCSDVATEMIARINGENGWTDPHNKGTYDLLDGNSTSSVIDTKRLTGDGKYTDLQRFSFAASGSGCIVTACSESQVTSVVDYSTNFCDLHCLYCGSQDGCPVVKSDFAYSEDYKECSQNDKSACTK